MNSVWQYFTNTGDERKTRITIAGALAALVWGILLAVLGRSLRTIPATEPPLPQQLEMSVVEIPAPVPTPPAATTGPIQVPTHAPTASPPPKRLAVKPARTATEPVRRPMPSPKSEPATHSAQSAPVAQPDADSAARTSTAVAPQPPSEQASTGPSPGNSPARAIAQPLPSVPDDLREQAYRTVAVAHLVIHTDGSVAVELVKPTQYPRLNQILVETLRGWRFFPAMRDGHPVETEQDVRVHFNVS